MIENLWMMSVQAGILILIVLFLRAALQKYPKIYTYGLWALVLLRLLCPVFIESSLSLQPDLKNSGLMQSAGQQADILPAQNPAADINANGADINPGRADQQTPQTVGQPEGTVLPASPENGEKPDAAAAVTRAADILPAVLFALRAVYLMGAVFTAGIFLIQYIRIRQCVATAVRETKNIYLCERIDSPFVMGLVAPKIYLPYHVPQEEKSYILKHERIHIRHRDPVIRALGIAACCLHWWNPLVWYAVRKMNQDMEMFCDETAMAHAPLAERKAYSAALLHFSMRQSGLAVALSFGESNTERRVKNVMRKKRRNLLVAAALCVIAAGCAVAFLSVPAANDEDSQQVSGETENQDADTPLDLNMLRDLQMQYSKMEDLKISQSNRVQAMEQYRAVLLGEAAFYSVDAKKELNIAQMDEAFVKGVPAEPKRLVIMDLDGDGVREVILQVNVGDGDDHEYEILRWQDGTVYGYTIWARSFMDLKKDGSFSYSSGAADSGYGTISFTKDGYMIDRITYSESAYDSDNNLEVTYYVNHKPAEERRFWGAIDQQEVKGKVDWWEFTMISLLMDQEMLIAKSEARHDEIDNSNADVSSSSDFFGHWRVKAFVGTTGQYAMSTMETLELLSQEEIDDCIGTVIGYGSNSYTCKMPTAYSPDTTRLEVSRYEEGVDDEEDFQERWLIMPSGLGLDALTFSYVSADLGDAFGSFFYVMDADTILVYYKGAFFEAERMDREVVNNNTDEAYYEMATKYSKTEVESFAREVREQILNHDWEGLSEKFAYPTTIAGITYQNAQELLAGNPDAALTDDFLQKIREENCRNMFFNWQGIMMGETGQVWIAEILDDNMESMGLKILKINAGE